MRKYSVLIWLDDNGAYSAKVPALPGCYSAGDTLDEVRANIQEAIQLYIETLEKYGRPVPEDRGVQLLEVAVA